MLLISHGPSSKKAKENTCGLSGVALFKTNPRSVFPFRDGIFVCTFNGKCWRVIIYHARRFMGNSG
jgi:hypothetical protein